MGVNKVCDNMDCLKIISGILQPDDLVSIGVGPVGSGTKKKTWSQILNSFFLSYGLNLFIQSIFKLRAKLIYPVD